jgi:1-deoxy-D-xylulose-5-phosphate reductoisomerase
LAAIGTLQFERPDTTRFPCLRLAYDALKAGAAAVIALNAANEVAVAEFLDHRIGFLDIPRLIETAVENTPGQRIATIEDVEAVDRNARALTLSACVRQPKNQTGGARA